jgi:hypothetical protein
VFTLVDVTVLVAVLLVVAVLVFVVFTVLVELEVLLVSIKLADPYPLDIELWLIKVCAIAAPAIERASNPAVIILFIVVHLRV